MTEKNLEKNIEGVRALGVTDTYTIFTKVSGNKIGKRKYFVAYNKSFAALLKINKLPSLEKYPIVRWIIANREKYRFVYATGGQAAETRYVLKRLGLLKYFDMQNSIDKSCCRFSKQTGIPFRKILAWRKPDSTSKGQPEKHCNESFSFRHWILCL